MLYSINVYIDSGGIILMKKKESKTTLIRDALKALQIKRFTLAIHDQSFPSFADEEIGYGSIYSRGAVDLLSFVKELGFDTVQLGPQGKTTRFNISPYNSSIFSKNPLLLSLWRLNEKYPFLLSGQDLEKLTDSTPCNTEISDYEVDNERAWDTVEKTVSKVFSKFSERKNIDPEFLERFVKFRRIISKGPDWLEKDAVFEVLSSQYGTDDWKKWTGPDNSFIDRDLYCSANLHDKALERIKRIHEKNSEKIEKYALVQFLLAEQHLETRAEVKRKGLRLYGDMQIGYSFQDIWALRDLFLKNYYMGAPPSRTNPEGQPWGYPVLDPDLYHVKNDFGSAMILMKTRIEKMFSEFDGLRIDHPHGLVCPWVYKLSDPDPYHSVQNGARLFSSPNLSDHPDLAKYSIVSPQQISTDPDCKRYDDNRVQNLTDEQTDRYAVMLDLILELAKKAGVSQDDILCEVLSTWPYPLRQVMTRRGLGRFCVTQKADPFNSRDVYRRENTSPQDWIMAGNHDTKPVLLVAEKNTGSQWYSARCRILAQELVPESGRDEYYSLLTRNPREFRDAMIAELFLGPAQNVSVFFPDLFGMKEIYNKPGVMDTQNWKLRVPRKFRDFYAGPTQSGNAPKLEKCLAMALRARFRNITEIERLCRNLET